MRYMSLNFSIESTSLFIKNILFVVVAQISDKLCNKSYHVIKEIQICLTDVSLLNGHIAVVACAIFCVQYQQVIHIIKS